MRCPKYAAASIAYQGFIAPLEVECDKEECAWWRKDKEECAILGLSYQLEALACALVAVQQVRH